MLLKQSSTAQPLMFQMIDSSDHIAGKTGLTPTVTLSKNGGAFASPAGAVTEISAGWYKVAGNATDTGTLGPLILHATSAGADPVDVVFNVVAYDPQDAVHLGLSAIPNVASGSAGAIPTTGSGANQIAVNGSGKISGVVLADTITTYTGNTPQTGDNFAIVNSATFGNAKLVRSTTPANALAVNNLGYILGAVDVFGSVAGDVTGKVLGNGDGVFVDVGVSVDKTGYALAANGLNSITVTPPSTVATTFPSMVVQLWRRFFCKATETSTQLKTFADDGTTIVTQQTVGNDGTTQTQGSAS